jgi:hypothetical protein
MKKVNVKLIMKWIVKEDVFVMIIKNRILIANRR